MKNFLKLLVSVFFVSFAFLQTAQASCDVSFVRTDVAKIETIQTGDCTSSVVQIADLNTEKPQNMPEKSSESPMIIFDVTSEDIGNYRIEEMKKENIAYTNPEYSVRIREKASMKSQTTAYTLKNDAVVVEKEVGAWSQVETAVVEVENTWTNNVEANVEKGSEGYIATRFLRDPNPSDLVRIFQADSAYWSDIAEVKVAHKVNVRSNPWYGAKVVDVFVNKTPVYVISEVNNWSEIRSLDNEIYGYIRSDFINVIKHQRKEIPSIRR